MSFTDPRVIAANLGHLGTRTARAPPSVRHRPHPLVTPIAAALRAHPGVRVVARNARQPGGHDVVSEATFAASACLDWLRASRVPAQLAMTSLPSDSGAAWRHGCLSCLANQNHHREHLSVQQLAVPLLAP